MARSEVSHFKEILRQTEMYFARAYHAGTREMILRYVAVSVPDVRHIEISAALRILRDRGYVTWEKHVWWNTGA